MKNVSHTIRVARADDVQVLALLESTSFSDPWPATAFTSVMAMPSALTIVAVDASDVPLGYCVLLVASDQGEIANLSVAPDARRQGIAHALLQQALTFARSRGVVAVYLEVRASNEAAKSLYRSFKFQEVGRRRGYYQRPPEDALVLQWTDAGA